MGGGKRIDGSKLACPMKAHLFVEPIGESVSVAGFLKKEKKPRVLVNVNRFVLFLLLGIELIYCYNSICIYLNEKEK